MSKKIILEKNDELFLREFDGKEIVEILDKEGKAPEFLRELINGPCDCDKLDYLMRDSHHIGASEYGSIDADRIIDGFRIKDQLLCISSSALHAMMNSFRAIQSMYTAIYYHKTSRVFDFMIIDTFKEIPEFVEEIISSIDIFLQYDDRSIIYTIKERSHGKNKDAEKYKKAISLFNKILDRKKTYKHILDFPLSFPLAVKKEARDDIEDTVLLIKKEIAEDGCEDFNIRFDYKPAIKPVGMELNEIINWLRAKRIYDTSDNEVKKLEDIYKSYFRDLIRYSILFRIFVDRKKYKEQPKKIGKIREKAKNILAEFESKWSEMLLP